MILVLTGTQKQRVDRIFKLFENLPESLRKDLYIQSPYQPEISIPYNYLGMVTSEEMKELMISADVIISHGGTATLMQAIQMKKKIIAFARLSKYGEHVDDHQREIIDLLDESGCVIQYVDEKNNLEELLRKINGFQPKDYPFREIDFKLGEKIRKSIDADPIDVL